MYFYISCLLMFVCGFTLDALQVSGLTYHTAMQPGETVRASVVLMSDRDTPELVDLKLCDYGSNADGQHHFDPISNKDRSNAPWITLSSHRETINPGESREIFMTIKAPNQANLNGSYWSVLLIEPTDPLQTIVEPAQGFQLNIKIRYAFHIVTDLPNAKPALKVVDKGWENVEQKQFFYIDVANIGTAFLNPKLAIKFLNAKGKLEKSAEILPNRLYPGNSSRFLANTEGLSKGKYTTFVLFDNNDGRLFGDSFELTVD